MKKIVIFGKFLKNLFNFGIAGKTNAGAEFECVQKFILKIIFESISTKRITGNQEFQTVKIVKCS